MPGHITISRKPSTARHGNSHHALGAHRFVGIDGEGITLPGNEHRYVLLRVGTNEPLTNPEGIGWHEAFPYLYSHYQPKTAYVGFYLGYDFTQIFKTLPEKKARLLLTREGQAMRAHKMAHRPPWPVTLPGWQFDLGMGGRRLRLRPQPCECRLCNCKHVKGIPWMYVCDAGGFFQTSFLVAIDPARWPQPILTDEEYTLIRQGKERRAGAMLDAEMKFYNALENDVMGRLMVVLDDGVRKLGVNLSVTQWFSPAQPAQEWLTGKAPTREEMLDYVPDWFRDAAREGYIAGWFELFVHGRVKILYQYDVNSAYPNIIQDLPCLKHGKWTRGKGKPAKPGKYTLVKAWVRTPTGFGPSGHQHWYIGSMLHRSYDGSICRPRMTENWYWWPELEAARNAGCIGQVKYREWMTYDPCDCKPPLADIARLYKVRLEAGKNTPMGRGARLVYNSAYGKLAQNVGMPKFMNFIYASLITSGCRIKILEAIATHPDGAAAIAQIATDAVYFMTPHPSLPLSNKLGEWEETLHHNVTLFKPGVYWDDEAREAWQDSSRAQFKARGIDARAFAPLLGNIDSQFDAWNGKPPKITGKKNTQWPTVYYHPGFQMITATQALARGKWHLAGTLQDEDFRQTSDPAAKRQDAWWDSKWGVYRSSPRKWGRYNLWLDLGGFRKDIGPASEPYDERFNLLAEGNPVGDDSKESFGITPDGPVDMLFGDAMIIDRKGGRNAND